MKVISASSRFVSVCLLISSISFTARSQSFQSAQQLNATVYDSQLSTYDLDSIVAVSPGVICVIGMSCAGCVEYFAEKNITNTFVYFVEDLSIMEMTRTRFQTKQQGLKFYFALRTKEADKLFTGHSPQLLLKSGNIVQLWNYDALVKLTNGFTLSRKKVRQILEKS